MVEIIIVLEEPPQGIVYCHSSISEGHICPTIRLFLKHCRARNSRLVPKSTFVYNNGRLQNHHRTKLSQMQASSWRERLHQDPATTTRRNDNSQKKQRQRKLRLG
jgi:hypothetical protein